jgi:RimJ/RimL family protein N-acetyltransferase
MSMQVVSEGRVRDHGRPLADWVPPRRVGSMVLEGTAVRLEPLAVEHGSQLHAANSVDDAIWDYLPYGPFRDCAEYEAWVSGVAGREDPVFFALIDRAIGRPGGVASLMRIAPEAGSIEVGHICLAPRMQRTRAASEAIFLLADWVFDAGYRRFEWKCDALNLASRRAAQRFGFSYEGVFRNHLVVKGRNRDTAWFAMTDHDWPSLRAAWMVWLDPETFDERGRQRRALGELTAPFRAATDPLV